MMTALSTFSKSAGSLDCVVHCAGIMKDAPLGMISQELADEVIGTNVIATLQVVQLATRIMSRHNSGSIILFNSVVGLDGALGQVLYSTSKAALTGLVKSAARELGPKGIRINAIAPGLIQTHLIKVLDRLGLSGDLAARLRQVRGEPAGAAGHPPLPPRMGRVLRPRGVLRAAPWLYTHSDMCITRPSAGVSLATTAPSQ
jgi:3-oxoacyl-[acyl-carrier protein] reductase